MVDESRTGDEPYTGVQSDAYGKIRPLEIRGYALEETRADGFGAEQSGTRWQPVPPNERGQRVGFEACELVDVEGAAPTHVNEAVRHYRARALILVECADAQI